MKQQSAIGQASPEDFQQQTAGAIGLLPSLSRGLDVNCHFKATTAFEYTQELTVFDVLNVPLYHGWVPQPFFFLAKCIPFWLSSPSAPID